MSHYSNDAIIDQAETEAIEAIVNKGIDPNHPAFDRLVDIKQEQIYQELLERPGPHGWKEWLQQKRFRQIDWLLREQERI